jgi:hypothetical protein
MGADWYMPFVLFGSSISIPSDKTFNRILSKLSSLPLEKPFQICGMLPEFHSRMEGMHESEYDSMSEYANIIIGFSPSDDMMVNIDLAAKLKDIMDSEPFNKYTFAEPRFHTGIDWEGNPYEDSEESEEEVMEAPK